MKGVLLSRLNNFTHLSISLSTESTGNGQQYYSHAKRLGKLVVKSKLRMNFCVVLLSIRASVSSSLTPDNTRFSGFLRTVEDYHLQGQVSHRQMTPSDLLCAQLCG